MNSYPDIPVIPRNIQFTGQFEVLLDIPFSEEAGSEAKLDLIAPWTLGQPAMAPDEPKKPLIVFVQGSAWTTPNPGLQLPALCRIAASGYRVATVVHRSIINGHKFPAFLEDVKCAIRFLRANADKYAIDPDRVAIWGTSSGGNTALLVGLTGDDPEYKGSEYAEYSDSVSTVVSCFGPTNLNALFDRAIRQGGSLDLLNAAFGPDQSVWQEKMREFSPVARIRKGKKYPSFFLLHGTADPVVPYVQMTELYEKMLDEGLTVSALAVDGAEHEGSFWTPATYEAIETWLAKEL